MSSHIKDFNEWLGKQPFKYKIVISGNHEVGFNKKGRAEVQKLLTNAVYLEDSGVEIEGNFLSTNNYSFTQLHYPYPLKASL